MWGSWGHDKRWFSTLHISWAYYTSSQPSERRLQLPWIYPHNAHCAHQPHSAGVLEHTVWAECGIVAPGIAPGIARSNQVKWLEKHHCEARHRAQLVIF